MTFVKKYLNFTCSQFHFIKIKNCSFKTDRIKRISTNYYDGPSVKEQIKTLYFHDPFFGENKKLYFHHFFFGGGGGGRKKTFGGVFCGVKEFS